ncbi:hypothetical protein [Peribacillus acanthi]|uniref:hypothetical protein n=1 Tax=Peribacillus acanthi TaxID=2171554 RepID=UPI000D3EE215|nr:hypothetical protein [Peribacillus acanthi]
MPVTTRILSKIVEKVPESLALGTFFDLWARLFPNSLNNLPNQAVLLPNGRYLLPNWHDILPNSPQNKKSAGSKTPCFHPYDLFECNIHEGTVKLPNPLDNLPNQAVLLPNGRHLLPNRDYILPNSPPERKKHGI